MNSNSRYGDAIMRACVWVDTVDAPGLALGGIHVVPGHGVRNGGGVPVDPVLVVHIMAVCTLVLHLHGLRRLLRLGLHSVR